MPSLRTPPDERGLPLSILYRLRTCVAATGRKILIQELFR